MIRSGIGQPLRMRKTPMTRAAPTATATHRRSWRAYAAASPGPAPMVPASEATRALAGDGDQRGFGERGSEAEREGERQQGGEAALANECRRHRLAEREQAHLQAADEERQAKDHEDAADENLAQVREGLAQDHDLEEGDDRDERGEVAECCGNEAKEAARERFHGSIGTCG